MKIFYLSKFAREYQKLPLRIKKIAEKKEQIFRKNPFDSKLKTHKLKGNLKGFLSFSINKKYRIIFEFVNSNTRAGRSRAKAKRISSSSLPSLLLRKSSVGEDERSSSTTIWFHSVGEHSIYKLWS